MKLSQFPLSTLKETPSDAEITSHQLMLRAGLVRKLASGLYTWLPLGLRVLRKVEAIVREEMNRSGGLEVSMPVVQPAELWVETERLDAYGKELLKFKDRHDREFCLGPTHEEVITDLARNELSSYKQLPINYYQIQTKFRDEIRPRFGIMRSREFIMKDAYSFHIDQTCLQQTYEVMHATYHRIFERLGLQFRAVDADTGSIGGSTSHEFHVLADSGEDEIAVSDTSAYAANVELAEAVALTLPQQPAKPLEIAETPGQHSIDEVAKFLNVDTQQCIKTLLVNGEEETVIALVLRGDHELNELKAQKLDGVATPLTFAEDEQIQAAAGCSAGSIGPFGLSVPVIIDRSAAQLSNFVCGTNEDGKHQVNANWDDDLSTLRIEDIRKVCAGDPSPDGQGLLSITRGIEVGHIFQLGTKYTQSMGATVLDQNGKSTVMTMGCYGIGVTRIVAAAIEQHNDDKGILWPGPMAPFQVAVLPMNMKKSEHVAKTAAHLYQQLNELGIEAVLDDRPVRPGVMFKDAELIGIPHRIVISDKGLNNNLIEYKGRQDASNQEIQLDEIIAFIQSQIA